MVNGDSISLQKLEEKCKRMGIKLTHQRREILKYLLVGDHLSAGEIHHQLQVDGYNIGIATVYRTVKLFKDADIVDAHRFGNKGEERYESSLSLHHDHLIDLDSGEVVEFHSKEIEDLQDKVAKKLGYKLKGHKLNLYGVKENKGND